MQLHPVIKKDKEQIEQEEEVRTGGEAASSHPVGEDTVRRACSHTHTHSRSDNLGVIPVTPAILLPRAVSV